jgi:hypothetical protein
MSGVTVRVELGGSGLGRFDSTIRSAGDRVPEGRGVSLDPQHDRLDDRRIWLGGVRKQVVRNLTSMDSIASYRLTELGSGSDATALRTRAVLDGDAYVVNGEEGFVRVVTRADNSVVLRVHAAGAGVSKPLAALTIRAHPTMSEAFHESVLAALGHPLHI